ncbi:MAG TPA: tetratricopeptide repeat protein [Candidatus Methylacidiphilales bacterium]|nr:tetratricopeptide repeat protein [Candidatus Methylacidiphilales bacterium]
MAKRHKQKKAVGREIFPPADGKAPLAWALPSWLRHGGFFWLFLILAVFLAYAPVWEAGFIWDDNTFVTQNPCITGPLGLKEIWTTSAADICPLALTTVWVEHALWGLTPLPYHLMNVLLHAANAVLLWQVLQRLKIPGARLGAALWALHPAEAESVAWITEIKNTQSALFFLLSILFFVKWIQTGDLAGRPVRRWNYAWTLFFAALAMASKSSTMILPAVLCLCAWWVERRWRWRNLTRVAPIVLMAVASGALAIWTQGLKVPIINDSTWMRPWPERLSIAGGAVWFYLGKLLWPYPLVSIYPRWRIDAGDWISYLPLTAITALFFVLWLKRESWARPWFFALAYVLVALLPAVGLVNMNFFRYSPVADHFQYLAGMGLLALVGAGLTRLAGFIIPKRPLLQLIFSGGLLLILGLLTWQRTWAFHSDETLWANAAAHNPTNWMVQNNLGEAFLQQGRMDEAMEAFQRALKINPKLAEVHDNLGNVLAQKGEWDNAIVEFRKALAINPKLYEINDDLGTVLAQKGELNDAIIEFRKALEINPNYARAHTDLGHGLAQQGQADAALAQFQKALEIDPAFASAHYGLADVLEQKGQIDAAVAEFQKTVELNPNFADAYFSLGNLFIQKRRWDEAADAFQQALEINPSYAEAYNNLGWVLLQQGQADKAIIQLQKALDLNPNYVNAQNNLAQARAMALARQNASPR